MMLNAFELLGLIDIFSEILVAFSRCALFLGQIMIVRKRFISSKLVSR